MRANPDKCQCSVFDKKCQSNESIIIIDTTKLIPMDSCNYWVSRLIDN